MRIDPEKMLELYRHGVFPMGDHDGKLYLISPDPRTILPLDAFRISHGLAAKLSSRRFPVTFDPGRRDTGACAGGRSGSVLPGAGLSAAPTDRHAGTEVEVEATPEFMG